MIRINQLIDQVQNGENLIFNSTNLITSMEKYYHKKFGVSFDSQSLKEVRDILEKIRFGQGELKDADKEIILGLIKKVKADFLGSLR